MDWEILLRSAVLNPGNVPKEFRGHPAASWGEDLSHRGGARESRETPVPGVRPLSVGVVLLLPVRQETYYRKCIVP